MGLFKTLPREQISNLDSLPFLDRSLIDYSKYHKFIGHAGVQNSMSIQATRGCPYRCFFCDIFKINKKHYRRSVENIFMEVCALASRMGVKKIEFIDDNFNVNKGDFKAFFKLVLKHKLKLTFFFPTGLRGDLLDKDSIDLMVEAGTIGINLALEHPSLRIQKIMKKELNIEKLHQNLSYITEKYPSVILTLNAMHGFPTETESEAYQTLDFINSIHWVHFPYLHNVIIFPGTGLETFALENGIKKEDIDKSVNLSYHEYPTTLPFSKEFTEHIRISFLRDYILNKKRLNDILPYQFKQFTREELDQKYNGYFPSKSMTLEKLLKISHIDNLRISPRKQDTISYVSKRQFPKAKYALKLLLLDLTAFSSIEKDKYNVFEPPIGLMYLLSYLNRRFGIMIEGRICKPQIDFTNEKELLNIIKNFQPHVIGIRGMTVYKDIFYKTIEQIRNENGTVPIVTGGPYPTTSYEEVLNSSTVDVVVIGEGEKTFAELIESIIMNDNKLPDVEQLKSINGIAFNIKEE